MNTATTNRPFVIIDEQSWYGYFLDDWKIKYKIAHYFLSFVRKFKFVEVINTHPNKKILVEISNCESQLEESFKIVDATK